MPISAVERKYLKKKHTGGKSNSQGNDYEDYFSVFKIAVLLHLYRDQWNDTKIASQILSFVDDLIVKHPGSQKDYFQLKNVKSLKWNQGKNGHSIYKDFKRQKEICEELQENFTLSLVYSDAGCTVSTIPVDISTVTSAIHFPYCTSINALLLSSAEFKNAIKDMAKNPNCNDAELSGIASTILGAWKSNRQEELSLQSIVDCIDTMGCGYINLVSTSDITISSNCDEILSSIKGLKYTVIGKNVHFEFPNITADIVWTETKEKLIMENKPRTILDLITLL